MGLYLHQQKRSMAVDPAGSVFFDPHGSIVGMPTVLRLEKRYLDIAAGTIFRWSPGLRSYLDPAGKAPISLLTIFHHWRRGHVFLPVPKGQIAFHGIAA